MTEQELKKELEAEKFRRVYFIYGEDSYLKNRYARLICEKSASILPDMNLIKIDGKKASVKKIYDETEQLPCMADYRCVFLNDYNFAAANDSEQKDFLKIVGDLPDTTVLVILCDTFEIAPKKPGKWQKLIKEAEKCGAVINFEHMSVGNLRNLLVKSCKKRKVMLDLSTAEHLIECCGRELSKLQGEIEKLCCYAGEDGRITKDDIDRICAKTTDANKYQLSKYIIAGNVPKSLQMINDLFDMRMEPIQISTLIIGGFVDLYRAKIALDSKISAKDAAADLGYKGREFVVSNSMKSAAGLKNSTLRKCLFILNENDIKLKSTSDDKRFLIEQTVLRVIRELKS